MEFGIWINEGRRWKGFAAGSILTFALGIGASTAMFSAVHAVLLRPTPIREPKNLAVVWSRDLPHHLPVVELSYREFQDWAARSRSFSHTAAMGSSTWPATLDVGNESVRLSSAGVSASFFDTLGVAPALGRALKPEDDVPGAARVVVLSHTAWTTRFGADIGIIGRTIQLGEPHIVIGVMPEGFDFPRGTDFWTPVVPILARSGGGWDPQALVQVGALFMVGRLRPGITPAAAAAELGGAMTVVPFLDHVIGPVRPALWALFAGVCILLLIACANVSGLMLTRASLRERELAVRLALGATRARIARDWMLETLVLAASGGALGLAASRWMVDAIVALAPADVPGLGEIAIDGTAAGFSVMAVVAAALLCGAASVRHASAARLLGVLHGGTRSTPGRTTHRARSIMLVVQIALSVVLLVAAGLVVRSFANLRQIDPGFSPARVLTMTLEPRDPKPSANAWMGELVARVSAMRGVESAGAVFLRPLALGVIGQETTVVLDGQPATPEAARLNPLLNYEVATPGYFATMRITLKRGRLFDAQDSASAPHVAIVSESTARRLWPGDDPIGRRLLMPTFVTGKPGNAWRTVVGVVGDVRYRGIDDVRLDVYDAAMQSTTGALDLVVRTSGDPRSVASAVQAEARRLDPHVVIDRMTTMETVVAQTVAPWRFAMWTFAVFAALAVALAMVGLFSVVSLDVAQRRRELAIRVALGAQRHDVLRPVLGPAAARVAIGVAIGTAVSTAGAHAIRSLLFGVGTLDPSTYAVAIGLMAATVAVASYVPARRAARVDPMDALRAE